MVLVLTDASTVQPLPDAFGNIANGDFLGLPNLLWIFVVVVVIASFVLRRTVFGRYVYAVGSNPESARLAGVPVTRVLVARVRDRRACSPRSAACCSPRA